MTKKINPLKERQEDLYALQQLGQESEREGVRATNQYFKLKQLEEEGVRQTQLTILDQRRGRGYKFYTPVLADFVRYYLLKEELDPKVYVNIQADKVGVVMVVMFKGRKFLRAFKACYDPLMDLNAVTSFATSVTALVGRIEDKRRVILPGEEN